ITGRLRGCGNASSREGAGGRGCGIGAGVRGQQQGSVPAPRPGIHEYADVSLAARDHRGLVQESRAGRADDDAAGAMAATDRALHYVDPELGVGAAADRLDCNGMGSRRDRDGPVTRYLAPDLSLRAVAVVVRAALSVRCGGSGDDHDQVSIAWRSEGAVEGAYVRPAGRPLDAQNAYAQEQPN